MHCCDGAILRHWRPKIQHDIDKVAVALCVCVCCMYSFHTPIGNIIHLIFQFEFRLVSFIEGFSFRSFPIPLGALRWKQVKINMKSVPSKKFVRKLHWREREGERERERKSARRWDTGNEERVREEPPAHYCWMVTYIHNIESMARRKFVCDVA